VQILAHRSVPKRGTIATSSHVTMIISGHGVQDLDSAMYNAFTFTDRKNSSSPKISQKNVISQGID